MIKLFVVLTLSTVLAANPLATIEQDNMKDLGRRLLASTYNYFADKLGPAFAEYTDGSRYASDALNSLERNAIINHYSRPGFVRTPQNIAVIQQNPLRGLGIKLFTTAFNYITDKLGEDAPIDGRSYNTYALNALKLLTRAERETALQQSNKASKTRVAHPREQKMGATDGFFGLHADEEAKEQQIMNAIVPLFTNVLNKMLEKEG